MVTIPCVVEDLLAQGLVDLLLSCILTLSTALLKDAVDLFEAVVGPETVIEGKRLLLSGVRIKELGCGPLHVNTTLGVALDFSFVEWSDSDRNLYAHLIIT